MTVRKLLPWKAKEVSVIYWLVLWGLQTKEIVELSSPILTDRTHDGIGWMCTEVRKQVSILKKFEVTVPPQRGTAKLVREAAKLDPHKDIITLKPENLADVKFIPSLNRGPKPKTKVPQPHFEQVEKNETGFTREPYKLKGVKAHYVTKTVDSVSEHPLSKLPSTIDKIENSVKGDYSLEEVLAICKKVGASKVQYKDYIIKFV